MTSPPLPSKVTPNGVLNLRPHGMFFSMPITPPSRSIHPMLPAPTPNIKSINVQQQPRQKMPWSKPIRKDCCSSFPPLQRALIKLKGDRHLSRQWYFNGVN